MTVDVRSCSSPAEKRRSIEMYDEVWPHRAVSAETVDAWRRAARASVEFLSVVDDGVAGSAAVALETSRPGIAITLVTRGVGSKALPDDPGAEEWTPPPFEQFAATHLRGMILLAVADGDVVGYAKLILGPDGPSGDHGITAVKRDRRGRGIATSLKGHRSPKAQGFERLTASNEERNATMRRINESLGYRPAPGRVRLRAPLRAVRGYPEAAMWKGSRFAALAAGAALALAAPGGADAARPSGGCMRLTFYAPTDWIRLATTLAANQAPCAQYYISIPPLAADKTTFRPDQPWRIRALGSNFHAVAEISYRGWSDWVAANSTTWYAAGVEARRRIAAQGFDVTAGDTWAVNESSSAVRTGSGAARQNLRDLVRGLYDAGGNGPPVKGIVFVVGAVQSSTNLSTYKGTLQRWYADTPFWTDMAAYVSDWSQETFGDIRNYAVAGAPLTTRRDQLNAWLQHPETLAAAGPPEIAAAESFLQAAYSPLANAAWRYPAGSGFGMTDVPTAQMQDYVSAQVYAARSAGDNFGFAWTPKRPDGVSVTDFTRDSGALVTRLAAAIHDAASSPEAACAGTCTAAISGASFNEAWKIFGSWSTEALVFANPSASTVAGTAVPLTVRLQLAGVIRPDTQPVTVTFTTSSSRGGFSTSATGPWTKTLAVQIPVGSTDALVYYRDTRTGTPTISAAAPGRAGVQQLVRVQPGSIARLTVTPRVVALGAGTKRRFTATVVDAFGNAVAVVPRWSASGGKVSPASGASTTFTASRPGKARITATAGTARAGVVVNVAATVRVTRVGYAVAGGRLNVTLVVADWRRHRVAHAAVRLALRRNGRWLTTVMLRTDARGLASFARPARRGCYSVWIGKLAKRGFTWNGVTPRNGSCVP